MNIIEIQHLKKVYNRKNIFENLNIEIPNKGIVLLKGDNGKGKSTLLKIIAKMIKSDFGTIKYNDTQFFHKSGFLLDTPILLENLNFADNISLIGNLLKLKNDDIQNSILKYQEIFDLPTKTLYKDFSLGMKKKAEIARTLINNPHYIFWDEPFNSLDKMSIDIILNEILDINKLFFITTHENYLDEKSDKIINM
ncbi:MAG: ATP-binding cassette domain-containing protein [Cruoricaptor ignavus]|nr:ATP-binding cassette domain-containing protein [Cruoricaptor ignavus]